MTPATVRVLLATALIGWSSLAAAAPGFGACGHGRTSHARWPPCGNEQVWDTQYQRCLSFSAHGPPDQPAWPRGPSWAANTFDYDRALPGGQ